MSDLPTWLPPLLLLSECDGDPTRYLEAVYAAFKKDFVDSSPHFRKQRIGLKRHPVIDGKEATFWHLISEGKDEANRLPDMRRCERIRWPRPMIEAEEWSAVHCWSGMRKGEQRVYLALMDYSYLVVLAVRNGYFILWTAFCVEQQHQRRKLQQEHAASLKS